MGLASLGDNGPLIFEVLYNTFGRVNSFFKMGIVAGCLLLMGLGPAFGTEVVSESQKIPIHLESKFLQAGPGGWFFAGGGVTVAGPDMHMKGAHLLANWPRQILTIKGPSELSTSTLLIKAETITVDIQNSQANASNVKVEHGPYSITAKGFSSLSGSRSLTDLRLLPRDPKLRNRIRLEAPFARFSDGQKLKLKHPAVFIENMRIIRLSQFKLSLATVKSLTDPTETPLQGSRWSMTKVGVFGDRGVGVRRMDKFPLWKRGGVSGLSGLVLSLKERDGSVTGQPSEKDRLLSQGGISVGPMALVFGRDLVEDGRGRAFVVRMNPQISLAKAWEKGSLISTLELRAGQLRADPRPSQEKYFSGKFSAAKLIQKKGNRTLYGLGHLRTSQYASGVGSKKHRFGQIGLKWSQGNFLKFERTLDAQITWTFFEEGRSRYLFEGKPGPTHLAVRAAFPFQKNRWRAVGYLDAFNEPGQVIRHSVELQKNYTLYHLYARYSLDTEGISMGVRLQETDLFAPITPAVLEDPRPW